MKDKKKDDKCPKTEHVEKSPVQKAAETDRDWENMHRVGR